MMYCGASFLPQILDRIQSSNMMNRPNFPCHLFQIQSSYVPLYLHCKTLPQLQYMSLSPLHLRFSIRSLSDRSVCMCSQFPRFISKITDFHWSVSVSCGKFFFQCMQNFVKDSRLIFIIDFPSNCCLRIVQCFHGHKSFDLYM